MLAISPLFSIVGTALLIASHTFAAPLSHSPVNSIEGGVTPPTHSRLTDATTTTTHRDPTAVARYRAPNPGEEKWGIKSTTTDRFPAVVVAKDHASLNLRKEAINPTTTTHPIKTTLVAEDSAQSPRKKDIVQSKPEAKPHVSPASSANIQYHATVKRDVLGPFLYAPLVPSSFYIAEEEWYKKNKKQDGQIQLDNSLDKKAKGGRTRIEGEVKG